MAKDKGRKNKKKGGGKKGGGKKLPGREIRKLAKGLIGKPPKALRPTDESKLREQAAKTMESIFAPAYAELAGQEKTLRSVDAKRSRDNKYYLDWLDSQSKQLSAHSRAADDKIAASQKEIADTANAATAGMREKLISEAGKHSQVVSNARQASAFEVSPEAKRSAEMIANERERTRSSVESAEKSRQVSAASNYAATAASEAKRVSDLWSGLKDIATGKNQIKLEQAAESAKEVARLLDREIEKAQSRAEFKSLGLDAALQVRGQNIEKKRLKLDKWIAEQQMEHEARQGRKDRRLERKQSAKERKHEKKENQKDREAEAKDDEGDGKGRQKARAARASANDIVAQLGPGKAKQNFAQVVDKVMSQSDAGYNVARKAVRDAIRRAQQNQSGSGNAPIGGGHESPAD